MNLLLSLYAFSGLLLAGLSVPLIRRKIPPNGLYGFRLPATLSDPATWYASNEYAGRRFLIVGLGTAVGSIVLYFVFKPDIETYALSCLGWFLALFLWGMLGSILYLKSLR